MSHDQESERIATWMQQLANDPSEQTRRPLPDPDLLWMKAQLLDRQAEMNRALNPVGWCETVARILVGFAICWLALGWTKLLVIPAAAFLNPVWLSLAGSVLLAAIAMAAYSIWASD
jgi:hypothetical protein